MDLILPSTFMFIAYFLFHYFLVSLSQICGGIYGTTCCSGSMWNKALNECIPCMGYFGEDCRLACPPPTFGLKCQSICPCPADKCHHVYGCKRNPLIGCESGRYGDYCEKICRYPNYGEGCQQHCSCTKEHCNPSKGCVAGNITPYILESASSRLTSSEAFSSPLTITKTSSLSERVTKYSSLETTQEDVSQGTIDFCSKKTGQLRIENSSTTLIFTIVGLLVIAALSLVMYICIILFRAPVRSSSYI